MKNYILRNKILESQMLRILNHAIFIGKSYTVIKIKMRFY